MRHFLAPVVALLLAGCTPTQQEERRECQLEAFELSACNRAGLAAVSAQGVWNVQLSLGSGSLPSALRLLPDSSMLGLPLTERQTEGETLFLVADTTSSSGQSVRYAMAACEAPDPQRFKGLFRRCVAGATDLEGSFEALRLRWREGEQEALGLQLVSETALPPETLERSQSLAVDVAVAGGYAYVSALGGGLVIYDVSNPSAPRKVATLLPDNDLWQQSVVRGSWLMVASVREGVIFYDISEPSAPRRLRTVPTPAVEVQALHVEGERLYAVSPEPNAEVLIYDLSQPGQVTLLARYYVEDSDPNMGDRPMDVAVSGQRLYVSHWSYGVAVVDVTDPRKPTLLGRYSYPKAASRSLEVGALGERTLAFELSESWDGRLRVLDVSAPEGIIQIGELRLGVEMAPREAALVGTRLYVAWNQGGLRVLDVSTPGDPRQVAYYNTWRETDPRRGLSFYEGLTGLQVPGDGYIYAAESSRGLLIFREP